MFDKIASDWARKRQMPWRSFTPLFEKGFQIWFENFSNLKDHHFPLKLIMIDLGCGSGRHSEFFLQYTKRLIDLDQSRPMLLANTSHSIKIQGDLRALPFRAHIFDGICSVAAVHHVQGYSSRELLIEDLHRIAIKKAFICITVWRFYQTKFMQEYISQMKKFIGENLCKELEPLKIPNCHEINSSSLEFGDIQIPWTISQKKGNITINRYYHLFRANEFRVLFKSFLPIYRCTMGNNNQKTNFFFFGVNE